MVEMVNARRSAETKEERYDLFSGLLDAADGDLDGAAVITEDELIGQCYLSCHRKKVLTRLPREYVHFPSRWTRGRSTSFLRSCNLNCSSSTDDSPHTLLHVCHASSLPR
jgi:hypothetical protein